MALTLRAASPCKSAVLPISLPHAGEAISSRRYFKPVSEYAVGDQGLEHGFPRAAPVRARNQRVRLGGYLEIGHDHSERQAGHERRERVAAVGALVHADVSADE